MRTLFVSNRLPIVAEKGEGGWTSHAASGGLVTALAPLLRQRGGMWIGWAGTSEIGGEELEKMTAEFGEREGYTVCAVPLSAEEYAKFYRGFCNEIIWPLFHDLQSLANFEPEYWQSAQKVEEAFAEMVQRHAKAGELIWVHDYQLMGLGRMLVDRGVKNKLAFFLHIPFPAPDIFLKLPWRMEVLRGLLAYEVVGFQTKRDLGNFADCVGKLLPEAERRGGSDGLRFELAGRKCKAGAFPIGIDFAEFAEGAASAAVEERLRGLRAEYGTRQVVLGVDRLDYTKGIPYRLRAFGRALEKYPELHRRVTMLQVVIPSREEVPQYQRLKGEMEQLVARVNGKYTQPGWVPVHHLFRSVKREELLAWYRLADVGLVTPLKDGMNLVAKEYCASQTEENGVLMLSEFAGAWEQLGRWAVGVNPYDVEGVATAIRTAVMMGAQERRPAMRKLREKVKRENVYWWVDRFLAACGIDAGL